MSTFTYNPNGHRYELDGKRMTGVTTVLGVLSKPQLIPWAARMACEYVRNESPVERDPQTNLIAHYKVTEAILASAEKAHTKKKDDAADKGKDIHAEVEAYIKRVISGGGRAYALVDADDPIPALRAFADWAVSNNIRFLSSEEPVYSREWFVAGTPDFTFEKDGKKYVGDLKTYKKIWDIVPHIQCAAYAKMLTEHDHLNPYHGSVIVNINKETGELTEQWRYALEEDVKGFEACLYLYRLLNA